MSLSYFANLGGTPLTRSDVHWALEILRDSAGHHVRQPLARAGHPLAHAPERDWYHRVYREQVSEFPELMVPPGTVHHHVAHVKPVIIDYFTRLLEAI